MFKDEKDFQIWCGLVKLSAAAYRLIDNIRKSPPHRRVKSAAGNVSTQYQSRKMQRTIQAESHLNELAHIRKWEVSEDVIEFWDQPETITLKYLSKTGRHQGVRHTPDFFVIRKGSAGWVECKTDEDLEKLTIEMPNRYQKADGKWVCPPGELYAAQFGLTYEVYTSGDINWNFQRNVDWLQQYWYENCPAVDNGIATKVYEFVGAHAGITLKEAQELIVELTPDVANTLIAHGQIYTDLNASPLSEPESVHLYCTKLIADAYKARLDPTSGVVPSTANTVTVKQNALITWDGRTYRITNLGDHFIWLLSPDNDPVEIPVQQFEALIRQQKIVGVKTEKGNGEVSTARADASLRLSSADPEDLERANQRLTQLQEYWAGKEPRSASEARQLRRWGAAFKSAEQKCGIGFVGLLPNYNSSGNREPRHAAAILAKMDELIDREFETIVQKNYSVVYGLLVNECEESGHDVISLPTFIAKCKKRITYHSKLKRVGKRAAYAEKPKAEQWYWTLGINVPRHGTHPLHICHIDSTQLDVELVHSVTGVNMGRPWLTILMDAYTRRILAIYLSFDPPSYRTCMMVLRECVRRHGRLPQFLVVDQGKEYSSIYFESLTAIFNCHKKTRPAAEARNGNVLERLFGTANSTFIHNLSGNTQIMQNVRQVTKSVNPKNHATWTLEALYDMLESWAYDVYDKTVHPALGQSPRDAFEAGMVAAGSKEHSIIAYDDAFRFLTLPTTDRGKAKVQANTGVRVNYFDYWCEAMRDPEVENTTVPVRFDPMDSSVVHVYIKGQWMRARSPHHHILMGRSEKYLKLSADELRRQRKLHAKNYSVRAADLAKFITSCEVREVQLQGLKDKECLPIIDRINSSAQSSTAVSNGRVDTISPSADINTKSDDIPAPPASPSRPRRPLKVL